MLYIVATPIGNLGDITLRAIESFRDADIVFCEDTRVTRKLFEYYGISTPTESLNARTEEGKAERVIELLREGRTLALATDAGTPGISDPGSLLVSRVREALPEAKIVPVPGPSALTGALSVSGLRVQPFTFYGFLPHKKGRQTAIKEIAASTHAAVIFESPHRIEKLLGELGGALAPGRRVFVARELTKLFEEAAVGAAEDHLAYLVDNPDKKRGEFVVVVETA